MGYNPRMQKYTMSIDRKFENPYALVSFLDMDYPSDFYKLAKNLGVFFAQVAPVMIMTGNSRPYIQCAEMLQKAFKSEAVIEEFEGLEQWNSDSESRKLVDKMLLKINPEIAGLIVIADTRHTLTMSELLHRDGKYSATPVLHGHALGINNHGSKYNISSKGITLWASQLPQY